MKDTTKRAHGSARATGLDLIATFDDGRVVRFEIPTHGDLVIGRDVDADGVLDDASVSRKHVRLRAGATPTIEDLDSTNGTRVSGLPLTPGKTMDLRVGAVVEIGDVVLFVRPRGAAAVTVPPNHAVSVSPSPGAAPVATMPPGVVVGDPALRAMYELVPRIARSKISVLVLGETGTGKDVFAETVHRASERAQGPFVRINCAALSESLLEAELFGFEKGSFTGALQAKEGLFEAADGGSVFLDEIGEMAATVQAKLLRVLEQGEVTRIGSVKSKRVDVRFIAATHRDLEALAENGAFRSDLFFRLNGVAITLPALRDRKADIVPLAAHFLARVSTKTLTSEAASLLERYRWPGNVRELRNVIERAALLASGAHIEAHDLTFGRKSVADPGAPSSASVPPSAPLSAPVSSAGASSPAKSTPGDAERANVLRVMEECGHNQTRAAKVLGMARGTLIKRLEAYGLARPRKPSED